MPFYEYECSACRFYVEVLQKVSDPPLRKCPSCGKAKLTKLVSAPVFRLKGAGWYETDFKSDGENKRNLAEDKEAKEAKEGKEESKSESTEAKPAETKAAPETPKKAAAKAAPVKKAAAKPGKPKPSKAKPAARKKASRR